MSEVEKMYENAGVKFIIGVHCRAKTGDGCKSRCSVCDYNTKPKEYPPFTAEKQLELIKWLARFNVRIEYTEYTNAKYFIESHYHGYSVFMKYFEQALAGFINILWQDLTETERNEIRSILN